MSKKLTLEQIKSLSEEFEIEIPMIKALISTFGRPEGFSEETNDTVIHFEPYHFERYTGDKLPNGTENQITQRKAYNYAFGQNPRVAQLSTEWGIMKILGKYYIHAGYDTVDKMISSFQESEYNQLRGFFTYMKSTEQTHINMNACLKTKDFSSFASYYIGPYYKRQELHIKFKNEYHRQKAFM